MEAGAALPLKAAGAAPHRFNLQAVPSREQAGPHKPLCAMDFSVAWLAKIEMSTLCQFPKNPV
jgi:hypothetical protein